MTDHGRFNFDGIGDGCGGRGIGRACAQRLADEGARVVVTDLIWDMAREVEAGLPHGFLLGISR